jgi:hypothetical protein
LPRKNGARRSRILADTEAPEIAASEGLEFIRIWPENVYAVRSIGTCTDTDLLIPDTHDGIPVTIIETGAFWVAPLSQGSSAPTGRSRSDNTLPHRRTDWRLL